MHNIKRYYNDANKKEIQPKKNKAAYLINQNN